MLDTCKFQWQAGLDWSPYNTLKMLKSLKCTKNCEFQHPFFLPSSLHIRILSRPCVGKSYSPNLPSQHKGLVTTRSRSTPQRFRRKTLKTLSIIAFWGRWWAGKWGRETCPETKDLAEWNWLIDFHIDSLSLWWCWDYSEGWGVCHYGAARTRDWIDVLGYKCPLVVSDILSAEKKNVLRCALIPVGTCELLVCSSTSWGLCWQGMMSQPHNQGGLLDPILRPSHPPGSMDCLNASGMEMSKDSSIEAWILARFPRHGSATMVKSCKSWCGESPPFDV